MKSINQRVKETREAKGLSQSYVAKKVGLKQPTLSAFENGTGSTTVLAQIANVLDVSVDYLLTGKQSLPVHSKIEDWDDSTPLDDDETEIPFFKDFSFACGGGSIGEALAGVLMLIERSGLVFMVRTIIF